MPECKVTVSGTSAWYLVTKCITSSHIFTHKGFKMALDVMTMWPSLNRSEDNQLHDCFKAWRKKVEILNPGLALNKEPQEFICHCIQAWPGEIGQKHIKSVGVTGDDSTSQKHIKDAFHGQKKPRSNEIAVAMTYEQLVQADPGLPKYI